MHTLLGPFLRHWKKLQRDRGPESPRICRVSPGPLVLTQAGSRYTHPGRTLHFPLPSSHPKQLPSWLPSLIFTCQISAAATTQYYRLGGSNNRNSFSHTREPGSPPRCRQVCVLRPLSLACRWPSSCRLFPCCCSRALGFSLWLRISSSYKNTSQTGLGPTLNTSF